MKRRKKRNMTKSDSFVWKWPNDDAWSRDNTTISAHLWVVFSVHYPVFRPFHSLASRSSSYFLNFVFKNVHFNVNNGNHCNHHNSERFLVRSFFIWMRWSCLNAPNSGRVGDIQSSCFNLFLLFILFILVLFNKNNNYAAQLMNMDGKERSSFGH